MSLRCDKLEISLSNITASTQIEPLILNHLLGVNLLCGEMSDGTQHGIPLRLQMSYLLRIITHCHRTKSMDYSCIIPVTFLIQTLSN